MLGLISQVEYGGKLGGFGFSADRIDAPGLLVAVDPLKALFQIILFAQGGICQLKFVQVFH